MSSRDVGLYAPGDWMWRVNREAVLLLAGPRALLMQVAHPLVAAGVADHSEFRRAPLARLRGTLDAMLGMIFGSHDEAQQCARRVNTIHERVRGVLSSDTAAFARGTAYSALDPELLFWVHATLIDSALTAYESFVAPLREPDRQRFYEESKRMTPLLRLPVSALPSDYAAFRNAVDDMLAGPVLAVSDESREIADAVLHPTALPLPRRAFDWAAVVPLGLLPPDLRARYELPWSRRHEWTFRTARRAIQGALPALPDAARLMPRARRAERERQRAEHDLEAVPRAGSHS